TGSSAKQENQKAEMLIKKLYSYFRENTYRIPEEYRRIMHRTDADRAVCDYISGMSDKYAVDIYTEIFIPKFSK
ncbi:MAG: deoxyguanosinetriphosphate triphosphohydrolase, partial [Ruminococcus sp.]|nr:deoxyguanosinetriphosphate triphosphohydrolase [Ruminococcus sp.]